MVRIALAAITAIAVLTIANTTTLSQGTDPPTETAKLIFLHHSTGEHWLSDAGYTLPGELGVELRDNNYFVSDTNYGWDAPYNGGIGDTTDIGHWYTWFADTTVQGNGEARRDNIMGAVYTEYGDHSYTYTRLADPDPGRENEIVMLKSCFPNSRLRGSPVDPPAVGANPLRGQDCYREEQSVANAKGIYNDILAYFETRPDKLFVVIVGPPVSDGTYAANARGFSDWMVNDWLNDYNGGAGYPYTNVAVFDYFNILTSNGGDPDTNDLGEASGNHHRWWGGAEQHIHTVGSNVLAYPSGDDHPSSAGQHKATGEFVPLLNYWYSRWKDEGSFPVRINFQTAASAVPPEFLEDNSSGYANRGAFSFGWR